LIMKLKIGAELHNI